MSFPRPAAAAPAGDAEPTLIDSLLAEQRSLTAVEQFARAHERQELDAPSYRHLLPLSAPAAGEQYAFEVDLDQCSGCKACVTACHSLNGLDDGEAWRDVGALVGEALIPANDGRGGNRVVALQQAVTTACHHCVEPACLLGCPVLAYDKDPATGIVRHLDDQCIGCSYCILKCPYEVPKYSAQRGIVRKCDLCHGRLAVGEAPACVKACPNEAIRITLVHPKKPGTRNPEPGTPAWLPDSPDPSYTQPTTRYLTERTGVSMRAPDHSDPKPQPAHWPLILMLVLTQAGIGGLNAALWLEAIRGSNSAVIRLGVISTGVFFAGLLASIFHLGQPSKAWRVWLGWRTSWLSREAIALNLFAGVAIGAVVAKWHGPVSMIPWALVASIIGVAALAAQVMVYADTRREFWRWSSTGPRFLGSAIVLGLALALILQPAAPLGGALLIATLLKLALELRALQHAHSDSDLWTPLRRTAVLQLGVLRPILGARLLLAMAGGIFLPFSLAVRGGTPALALGAFALCLLGEIAERWLFFTSVAPIRMPGVR